MHEKYFSYLKKSLLSSKNPEFIFFILIKHFRIQELKKIPEFKQLQEIQLNIPPQQILTDVAMYLVRSQNLSNIKFLIDECRYDLIETHDDERLTLLHAACLTGSIELVEYLLEKGFSPNVQDVNGETPLHRGLKRGDSRNFIKLLQKYGANLNSKTNEGLTALNMAALYKNREAVEELINQGVDYKLTWNGLNYIQILSQGIRAAQRTKNSSSKKENVERTRAEYFKGCLLPTFNKSIFQNVVKELLKADELTGYDIRIFIQSTILISSFNPSQLRSLQKNLFMFLREKKLTIPRRDVVLYVLEASEFFEEEKRADFIKEFNSLTVSLLNSNEISDEDKCQFYSIVGLNYKSVGLLEKSQQYLQRALKKSACKTDPFKAELFFNLGCIQLSLLKLAESVENFGNAFNLDKDVTTFQYYISSLLQHKKYEEALIVCSEANFGKFSEAFAAFVRVLCGESSWLDLLEVVKEDVLDMTTQILLLDLRSECYLKLGDYDEAMKAAEACFSLNKKKLAGEIDTDMSSVILKVLKKLMETKNYQLGLERLHELERDYPHVLNDNVLYHNAAASLYVANRQFEEAKRSIQKIKNLHVDAGLLANICLSLGMEILSINPQDENSEAFYYINLAITSNPNHLEGKFYKLISLILNKNKAAAEEMLQTIEPEALLDISLATGVLKEKPVLPGDSADNVSVLEIIPESEEKSLEEQEEKLTIEDYDPVEIHKLIQAKKKDLLDKSIESLSQIPQPKAKWKIGPFTFEEEKEGLTLIEHHSYSPCYAVIHPHLALDTNLREFFQTALNKGVALRKNTDGVQTLNNAVVQLAIRAENRLFTNKIYRNENGQHLIVFDCRGNHAQVKRMAKQKCPLHVIQLAQSPQYIRPTDSILAAPEAKLPSEEISDKAVKTFFISE